MKQSEETKVRRVNLESSDVAKQRSSKQYYWQTTTCKDTVSTMHGLHAIRMVVLVVQRTFNRMQIGGGPYFHVA